MTLWNTTSAAKWKTSRSGGGARQVTHRKRQRERERQNLAGGEGRHSCRAVYVHVQFVGFLRLRAIVSSYLSNSRRKSTVSLVGSQRRRTNALSRFCCVMTELRSPLQSYEARPQLPNYNEATPQQFAQHPSVQLQRRCTKAR